MRFKWTEEKIQILRECYPTGDWNLIFEKLGTNNKASIMTIANRYGISMDTRIEWSEEKIRILERYYPDLDWDNLFLLLGTNSKNAIYNAARKFGIKENPAWTDDELSLLCEVIRFTQIVI